MMSTYWGVVQSPMEIVAILNSCVLRQHFPAASEAEVLQFSAPYSEEKILPLDSATVGFKPRVKS
jgi:hypothetical protein